MILPVIAALAIIGFIAAASRNSTTPENTGPKAPGSPAAGPPADPSDDAFDALVAAAIAKGDVAQLEALAKQADARGNAAQAKSIRDEIARITGSAPKATPVATPPSDKAPTPNHRPILKLGSKGPDVVEWQRIIGVKQDGIFGADTKAKTVAWQKAHGLVTDGIVGPATWAAAYAGEPSLATKPLPDMPAPIPGKAPTDGIVPAGYYTGPRRTLSVTSSKGADIAEWQRAVGVKDDGIFGSNTLKATQAWQKAHGLKADGIVGPATWAAYDKGPTFTIAPPPAASKALPPASPSGRPTLRLGSRGADVADWQRIVGVTPDGIYGAATLKATAAFQTAHGLKADGVVGPLTWGAVGQASAAPKPVAVPVSTGDRPVLKMGSSGALVKEWQRNVGVKDDGIFMSGTRDATIVWQKGHGLTPDGVVGPQSWAVYDGLAAQKGAQVYMASSVQPSPALHDADEAAKELTLYLRSLGGLAGKGKENKANVANWSKRLGVYDAKGMYGRDMARAVMQHGFVPVAPYYYPASIPLAKAKSEFTSLVQTYANSDPQRSAEWQKLLSDISKK